MKDTLSNSSDGPEVVDGAGATSAAACFDRDAPVCRFLREDVGPIIRDVHRVSKRRQHIINALAIGLFLPIVAAAVVDICRGGFSEHCLLYVGSLMVSAIFACALVSRTQGWDVEMVSVRFSIAACDYAGVQEWLKHAAAKHQEFDVLIDKFITLAKELKSDGG